MSTWTHDEFDRIGGADELGIASRRPDGSLRTHITIWVVRAGDDLYIRSAYGTDNPWFRRARASGRGSVRAGGIERDVTIELVPSGAVSRHDAIDAAYHAKYDRYGARIVDTVVGPVPAESTFRLVKEQ